MAKSTFSHVPAILSRGCVVYQHHWRAPLAEWLTLESLEEALPRCLEERAWADEKGSEGERGEDGTSANFPSGGAAQPPASGHWASDELRG